MTEFTAFREMYQAKRNLLDYVVQGKWDEVMKVYKQHPWLHLEKITQDGDTALHIAVCDCKERGVVEEMVKLVRTHPQESEVVLKYRNEKGNTPLHLAATIGNVSMCECFARGHKDLVSNLNKDWETPLFLAARHGKIEAFLCLLDKASNLANIRNKNGETILHCAIAGGHFKLAYLIIERNKDLGRIFDNKRVSPLHLLANQPSAFRSGTRLSLIDKIIYHCVFVFPPCSGDAEKSDHPAERQTRVKLLSVLFKGLFFLIVKFIKICINPSAGAKAENAGTDLDEETPAQAISERRPASTSDQGTHERNNEYEKKIGLTQRPDGVRNFPGNYDTCFNFIMLLIKAILVILLGRSYITKIQQKKEKHIWSAKILEKLLDKGKDSWYDCTRNDPLYELEPKHETKDRSQSWAIQIAERKPEDPGQKGKDLDTSMSPLLVAATKGITEMVEKILQTQPAAIQELDSAKKNVVLLAAEYKEFKVLRLLQKKFSNVKSAFRAVDNGANNALHLAAKYMPGQWVGIPEGLQLQMEIIGYEYVKKLVPEYILLGSNNNHETPEEMFRNTHKELLEKCRTWLKDTSNQCSALAGIIASITFATSTSIPGEIKDNGRPSLENQPGFTIFAVSSLIALSFSVTSAVVFLAIANSRHEERDFARKVPRMLFLGFFTLFISIVATLMSFCGAHIYLLGYKLKYASIPLYALVVLPLTLFSLSRLRLSYLALPLATFGVNVDDA